MSSKRRGDTAFAYMKTFYVTTSIYYANSLPHMGHLYTTVVGDFLKRYHGQRGYEAYFLTGTDEHGTNIERAAAKAGRTPREHVDYVVGELKQMFGAFALDSEHGGYDVFMRTTEPFHYEGASEFWRRAAARRTPKGRENIYKGFYEGWFCAPCATFKTEGEMLPAAEEGGPPLCPVHERPLDKVSEESYFFRLSDYDEALLALYESRPDFIRPEARRNEVVSLVRGGLEDVSISRLKSSVSWVILERSNSDLASGLGNLVSRTLTMIHKYFGGVVPAPDIPEAKRLLAKRAGVDSDAQELSSSLELVRDQYVQHV